MPRDSQRSKLYAAENMFRDLMRNDALLMGKIRHHEIVFDPKDIKSCQKYVNKLIKYKWFQKRWVSSNPWGRMSIKCVHINNDRRYATGERFYNGSGEIELPNWAKGEFIILHEVAHVITPNKYAPHGPEYCRNHIEIIKHVFGNEAAKELKACYDAKKVRWRKTRSLSYARIQHRKPSGSLLSFSRVDREVS